METYKIVMLVFVIALEVTSATALIVLWVKACKEAKKRRATMNEHDNEYYRNGYAKGYADAKKNEKHGRWEYHDCVNTGDGLIAVYACSVCGGCINEEVFSGLYNTEYCPNCGAIMDLPNITENTRKALEKMGENVHSGIDFDYAAED